MRNKINYTPKSNVNQHPVLNRAYGLNYKISDAKKFKESNKYKAALVIANKFCRVCIHTLNAIYDELCLASHEFSSTISQQKLAKKVGVGITTLQKAISGLRRAKLIYVNHRYIGEGAKRRRTTSRTVLTSFIDFCRYMKDKFVRKMNDRNIFKSNVSSAKNKKSTGIEYVNFDTGEVVPSYSCFS